MKQNLIITMKLILSATALLFLFIFLREKYEEVPIVSQVAEETPEGDKRDIHKEPYIDAYRLSDFDPGREIRVLLSNPAGGYFFETVEIRLKEQTYRFTKQDVLKRGAVRIQAGKARIAFLQRKSETCPALYPGSFFLRCGGQGIYVVNILPLEDYLKLVVPSEMPAGYSKEALKSQAVLARTYAVRCMLCPALPEYGADLDDTTGFQVYAAGGAEAASDRAVEDTAGLILCDGEQAADVYYFSTSCGQTTTTAAWNRLPKTAQNQPAEQEQWEEQSQSAEQNQPGTDFVRNAAGTAGNSVHVGRGRPGYTAEELRGEQVFKTFIETTSEDHFEKDVPWYRWEYRPQMDEKKFFQRIRERYALQPAQILSRPAGAREFTSGHLTDIGKIRDIRVTGRSPGGCALELTVNGTGGDIKIRTEYSIRYVLCDTVSEVLLQDGSTRRMGTVLPSAFFIIKTGKDRQDVIGYTLVGGGFGHGIGMSQNGAQAMAEEGYDYRGIIAFFYPAYQLIQLQRTG